MTGLIRNARSRRGFRHGMAERNLNFDEIVERRGTDCLKYDFAKRRGKPEDVLPLWVADMDFKTSSYVEDALIEGQSMGSLVTVIPRRNILTRWQDGWRHHHHWKIKEELADQDSERGICPRDGSKSIYTTR